MMAGLSRKEASFGHLCLTNRSFNYFIFSHFFSVSLSHSLVSLYCSSWLQTPGTKWILLPQPPEQLRKQVCAAMPSLDLLIVLDGTLSPSYTYNILYVSPFHQSLPSSLGQGRNSDCSPLHPSICHSASRIGFSKHCAHRC